MKRLRDAYEDYVTYDTPTKAAKPLEKCREEHAQKSGTPSTTAARELSNASAYEEYQGDRPWRVRLEVQLPLEASLAPRVVEMETTSWHTPNQVKERISAYIGVAAELLKLSSPLNASKPKFNGPLEESGWQDGSPIICHKLEIPASFDRVAECDECGDRRHVFYGYARQDPLAELEPVIELCADCSNRLQPSA